MGTIRGIRRCVTNSPLYLDLISVKNPVAYVTARTYRVAGARLRRSSAFFRYRSFVSRLDDHCAASLMSNLKYRVEKHVGGQRCE